MPPIFFSFSCKIHIPCTKGIRVLITAVVVTLRCPLITVIIALSKFINIIVSKCTWKKKGEGGIKGERWRFLRKVEALQESGWFLYWDSLYPICQRRSTNPFGWIWVEVLLYMPWEAKETSPCHLDGLWGSLYFKHSIGKLCDVDFKGLI